MNWFEQQDWSKFWAAAPGSVLSWPMPGQFEASDSPQNGTEHQDGTEQWNALIGRVMEGWAALSPFGSTSRGGNEGIDAAVLKKLFDPQEWSKALTSLPDLSLERLTEGPVFATLTDLDRKVANAQRLWNQRNEDIEAYRSIVQAAWGRAWERFLKGVNDEAAPPLSTGQQVLDLWLGIVNGALIELHHLPEFLEAQRRMTRSSAEYRLQERALAEVFCEARHIPTRTEVDEVQRTVHELRRELRAIQRWLAQGDPPRPARNGKRRTVAANGGKRA